MEEMPHGDGWLLPGSAADALRVEREIRVSSLGGREGMRYVP